jgi:hypothetical protein
VTSATGSEEDPLAADARLEELRIKQATTLKALTQDRANVSEAEIEAEQY